MAPYLEMNRLNSDLKLGHVPILSERKAMKKKIVIIGNGVTGTTAARHIRKQSDHDVTIISAETDHFFSRTALMYIYMGHMTYKDTKPYEDWFWEKNRLNLVRGYVEKVDFDNKSLQMQDGSKISYDALVLATGSKPNKFGWPGQDLQGVQGMYSYQDLESMEKYSPTTRRAVIVGGGLIGIEMAEMFLSRGIPVTFLVREQLYWSAVLPKEESEMVGRHILEHHVDLKLGVELKEILPDENGRARAVITSTGEEIACQFVGLTAGVSPNIEFLKDSPLEVARGIFVDHYLETNIPDVYAAGDCAQFREPLPGRRPIEQVWYTGKMHGETVAKNICSDTKSKYEPGIWFNSAKFFDIEYQTYGDVPAQFPEGIDSLYWEDSQRHRSVRINYEKDSHQVTGFNFFGIRARHHICERWLHEKQNIQYVLAHLGALNFDPEFFPRFEQDVLQHYNEKHPGKPVQLETKKGLFSKFFAVS